LTACTLACAGAPALEPPSSAALGESPSSAAGPSSGAAALPTWPASPASVVSEVTTSGGGIPGQVGDISAGAAARMLSRLEDVVALLRAACRLLLLTPDEVRQALRRGDDGKAAVDGGACPLWAVLAGALRGMPGFVLFVMVVAMGAEALGVAGALALGVAATLGWGGVVLALRRRPAPARIPQDRHSRR
jgi:hypothetical protein